ncbi:hypothetical protein NLI96_g4162 [Meripilus lineatus]|uniref:Peroxidase n=1 Tax=Meripilus lineatus TaxID=2056292 RepID=A0AAD5YIA6_9APHY|nr:hypothetical protein NLI96_g4162 [Physisporinus lineatus]
MIPISWKSLLSMTVLPNIVLAYTWPNPQLDELESQRYDRHGYNSRALSAGVSPCKNFLFGDTAGRANAADWIRTAYHDMATHNIVDGTGGLDASIRFEEDRAENAGDGFHLTLLVLTGESNRYASLADVLALGAITAIEQCGGPKISFRGGRVDATVANNPGVPEPQQDLASHIAAFTRQGFTKSEMIGLVACGHTFGGVQHDPFPNIVPESNDPNNTSGNVRFDSTFVTFDNKIATEFLDGTTGNPLVVGPEETNSDKRIFASDGNVTMSSFADAAVFASTCADLFARMLDTVPRGVQLSEVIEPLPVKPQGVYLLLLEDGSIQLNGEVRFWNTSENPNRKIQIKWKDRNGNPCDGCSKAIGHTIDQVSTFVANNEETTSVWYSFNQSATEFVTFDQHSSISKFWFEVDEGSGAQVADQNGASFEIQDVVMLADSSCRITSNLTLDIAIRKDVIPSRVYLKADDFANLAPFMRTIDVPPPASTSGGDSYNIWSISDTSLNRGWTIAVDVGDKTYETAYLQHHVFGTCS